MPGTERVVLRPSWLIVLNGVFIAVNGLLLGLKGHPVFLVGVPLGLGLLVPLLRARTVLDADGATVCDGLRTRRLAWGDVAAVAAEGRPALVTASGERVALQGVVARAWAPAEHVAPRSAQWVYEYAHARNPSIERAAS